MKASAQPIAILSDPNGRLAEAYRNLRVSIAKRITGNKKLFMVVSAWPGDGKSMVCTNLAVALSQLHLKVLLIDGDLRRPTISRVFSAHKKLGLTDLMEAPDLKEPTHFSTKIPNLFLLPRGLSEQNPSNLLGPDRLGKVFGPLKDTFDCLIMDTPPLSACSDALLLGAVSDGSVMIVSPKAWDGEVEARYKQQLVDHDIDVIGAVLNGANDTEQYGSAYGYGYGYGYGGSKGYGRSDGYGRPNEKPRKSAKSKSTVRWPWSRPDEE